MDDSVRSLIRFVSRGFYTTPFVLILDAVLRHSVLSEDDLIHLLGIKRKELRSLCNKLVEDRLLTSHVQREDNGQQKYVTRTYFSFTPLKLLIRLNGKCIRLSIN